MLLFASIITSAGISSQLNSTLLKNINTGSGASFSDKFIKGVVDGTSQSLLESAVYGTDLTEALEKNLRAQIVKVGTSEVFSHVVKPIDADSFSRNIAHKLAAALTGCVSAAANRQDCEAGAIGAAVGEMWGDWQVDAETQKLIDAGIITEGTPAYNQILNESKLIAGVVAAFAGKDVNVATGMAEEAVRWNTVKEQRYGKEYSVSKSNIYRHASHNLGDDYYARVDKNSPILEVHVYKYESGKLREVAIYHEGIGYIKKHGITMSEPNYPQNVSNKLKSLQIETLREKYPNKFDKGKFNIKGFNSANIFRATRFLGIGGSISIYNSHHQACLRATDPDIINEICNF